MQLGESYKRLNDFEKAVDYSERALSIYEGLAYSMATLNLQVSRAALFVETGRFEEAETILNSVLVKYREYEKREEVRHRSCGACKIAG